MLAQPVGHTFDAMTPLAPSQRIHLVLLGVQNVPRSAQFYEALGWTRSPTGNDGFVKFNMGGYAICLINREDFASDALSPTATGSGFAGVALIHLARNAEDVLRIRAFARG
ncbi:hypothetical protein GTP44_22865 [Duganella sp. FT50W]|uniref:VOC family protein n=1 Tax=Duganella lactea TaxID=2692173 RepID=A0A6L8MRW9_9BURK|nr:hypothetical protein [Duganella lactea]MYM84776.1 hypothetical protein [Duganella lactea]